MRGKNSGKNLTHDMCLKKNLNAPRPSEHPPVRGNFHHVFPVPFSIITPFVPSYY